MKIYPNQLEAGHFDIKNISVQELKNLLYALKHPSPPWQFNSPWGQRTIEQFEKAIKAEQTYKGTSW